MPYGDIALLWRAGCIIRSRFLGDIKASFAREPVPQSLLQDPFFAGELQQVEAGWRKAVALAVMQGVPAPALSSALAFYDGYRCADGSANILQAQRDFFGAHTVTSGLTAIRRCISIPIGASTTLREHGSEEQLS